MPAVICKLLKARPFLLSAPFLRLPCARLLVLFIILLCCYLASLKALQLASLTYSQSINFHSTLDTQHSVPESRLKLSMAVAVVVAEQPAAFANIIRKFCT